MSIKSHAFGRVTLTGEDARKFRSQVAHGRPTAAAKRSVTSGIRLSREYERSGKVYLTLKTPRG